MMFTSASTMLSDTLLLLLLFVANLDHIHSLPMTQNTLEHGEAMERLFQAWMERRRNEMLERVKTEIATPKGFTTANCISLWRPGVYGEPCTYSSPP
uniref:Uncharacterized protein n=1 Tax=Parascaris univalens TaxID=6257 RepID=A0A915CF20_PARUN